LEFSSEGLGTEYIMSSALVSGITEVFRSQIAGPFASTTGESESSVVRGFETALGTMVESLAAKIRQSGFASQLMDLINSPANDPRMLENSQKIFGSQPSEGLASKFEAQGYGENYPVANNVTNTGRQQNRRVALLVTQK
jgi:Bacterial protein of unknown function (DUF937)